MCATFSRSNISPQKASKTGLHFYIILAHTPCFRAHRHHQEEVAVPVGAAGQVAGRSRRSPAVGSTLPTEPGSAPGRVWRPRQPSAAGAGAAGLVELLGRRERESV